LLPIKNKSEDAMSLGWKAALAAAAVVLVSAGNAQGRGDYGPSFSCHGNLARVERMICNDSELSRLDRQVARLYRGAGGAEASTTNVRTYARGALASRSRCLSADCIRDVLQDEIGFLQEHQDGGGY
jgi:uncharacterized protein